MLLNAFYFTLKSFFVLKLFKFLSINFVFYFLVIKKNGFIGKISLFQIYDVTA